MSTRRAEEIREADEVARTVSRLRRVGTECDHGEPGGAELHPTSRLPLCPLCRLAARAPAG